MLKETGLTRAMRSGSVSGTIPEAERMVELARLAKALGHPIRVRILRYLAGRDSCMCGDLVEELTVAQSTVSQHLKILKEAGLIQGTIEPPRVCYCVRPTTLNRLRDLIDWATTLQKSDPDSTNEH